MRRELTESPAMAPIAPVATSFSLKSLSRFLREYDLEVKVIAAWVLWVILRHLQIILGPMRRRSGHWFVQYSAMAAYYLPTLVVFYTANAVYSSDSDIKVLLSTGCSVLLISCARGAVTMKAFSLGDGPLKLESWRLLPWLLYFAWLQWGLIWWDRKLTLRDLYSFIVQCLAPLLYVLLAKPRSRADILDYETKLFADQMMLESRRSSSPSPFFHCDADSSLYDGCKYPIMNKKGGRQDREQWITFSQVKQEGGLLKDTGDAEICLSYSFCRLLARRFFGFPCAEDGDAQVRDLVLKELLADDCSRAYNIVEVQLALLHDYFFTNYHSKITSGLLSVKQGVVFMLCMSVLAAISYAVGGLIGGGLSALGYLFGTGILVVFTYTAILQPQYPILPPYWHPIQNVILYYSREEDTGAAAAAPPPAAAAPGSRCQGSRQSSSYWRDNLGQYSLMEDYDRHSTRKVIVAWCNVHVLSQVSYKFIKHHPAEEEDVRVPDSVKILVARTIKDINAPPTTDVKDLSQTFRQETLTHTILIWHIATCYCDMMSCRSQSQDVDVDEDEEVPHQRLQEPSTVYHQVATTLSKYCAYLVAFLPELLPEHSLTAKVVLQQVLQEARDLLGTKRTSMEDKRRKLRARARARLEVRQDDENTFERGLRLGQELEKMSSVSWRWKAMTDFWCKTVLYIASSDKTSASHIERLAHGGEFVTHLWAMLCNAGILKRAAEVWTPQQFEASGRAEQDVPQADRVSGTTFYP